MRKIAIFASGSGTNAERISKYFINSDNGMVTLILSNNPDAYVIKRAENLNIKSVIFGKSSLYETDYVLNILKENKIDFIVLAGFLLLVPLPLIELYRNRIINIHPALLPKYGGKGMYGDNVHKAVIANKELESGITIHYVNEKYDEGNIIFQAKCKISNYDTPKSLAEKIHKLEYKHFPIVIENLIMTL